VAASTSVQRLPAEARPRRAENPKAQTIPERNRFAVQAAGRKSRLPASKACPKCVPEIEQGTIAPGFPPHRAGHDLGPSSEMLFPNRVFTWRRGTVQGRFHGSPRNWDVAADLGT